MSTIKINNKLANNPLQVLARTSLWAFRYYPLRGKTSNYIEKDEEIARLERLTEKK